VVCTYGVTTSVLSSSLTRRRFPPHDETWFEKGLDNGEAHEGRVGRAAIWWVQRPFSGVWSVRREASPAKGSWIGEPANEREPAQEDGAEVVPSPRRPAGHRPIEEKGLRPKPATAPKPPPPSGSGAGTPPQKKK
jgi:hypothetical protein